MLIKAFHITFCWKGVDKSIHFILKLMKDKVTTDANHKPIIANYMVDILNYHDGMVCRLPIVSQCSSLIRETSLILTSYVWIQLSVRHYIDVIMSTMASQITSLTVVYSTVYSDADQRKHQSSASLAFVWGIHRDRWIPRTKGQLRGKCLHLMTSSWITPLSESRVRNPSPPWTKWTPFRRRYFF